MIIVVGIHTRCRKLITSNLDQTKLGQVKPEDEDGSGEGRVGEDVEEAETEEGEDVLHVVEVSPTHSLYILIHPGLVRK